MAEAVEIPKPSHRHRHTPEGCGQLGRAEKIFIYFTADVPGHSRKGKWMVSEPLKPVCPDQIVTWQVVGKSKKKLSVDPSDVFEELERIDDFTVSAKLKHGLQPGLHSYKATVSDQPVIGGSSPNVIIDPAH